MTNDLAYILGQLVGFGMSLYIVWFLPVRAGLRMARSKNRSPHWMWFGLHPVGAWIVYFLLARSKPLPPPDSASQGSSGKKLDLDLPDVEGGSGGRGTTSGAPGG